MSQKRSKSRSSPISPSSEIIITSNDYRQWLNSNYIQDSKVIASSRTTPSPFPLSKWPAGRTWKLYSDSSDDSESNFSQPHIIDQLVFIPTFEVSPTEVTDLTRLDDVSRYSQWSTQAPPIDIVQTESGKFLCTNGHRRLLSAKQQNKPYILAWVSWSDSKGRALTDLERNTYIPKRQLNSQGYLLPKEK
jgi:hypothetical protein